MIVSQILTLYTTPVIYLFMERVGTKLGINKPVTSKADDDDAETTAVTKPPAPTTVEKQ